MTQSTEIDICFYSNFFPQMIAFFLTIAGDARLDS